MFGFIDNLVGSAINIVDDTIMGDGPKKEDVVRLLSTGLSVYLVASVLGTTVDVVKSLSEN